MVTPPPHTPGGPTLMWGGASLAAARRAGRYGLGLLANGGEPGMQEAYESASREHGHQPGPVLVPDRDTPTVVFVADDVDRAWDEIGEHLLHDARMYAEWNPDNEISAGYLVREGRCQSCGRPRSRTASSAWRKRSSECRPVRCSTCRRCVAACRLNWRGRISSGSARWCCPRPRGRAALPHRATGLVMH